MPRARHRTPLLAVLAVALWAVLAAPAFGDALSPESGPTPNAQKIDTLYWIVFVLGMIIFVAVEVALIYCMRRFRARRGAVAAQIRGNTRLEIGWTVGAALILVVLSVVTFVMLSDIRNPAPQEGPRAGDGGGDGMLLASVSRPDVPGGRSVEIEVNGQQYLWRYTYPDGDDNPLNNAFDYERMVVPTGVPVILRIVAQDVAHSWWIPALGGKFDAVPGHVNWTWFRVDEPGEWSGQCAELCGRNHANMTARVRALPPDEWEAYIERRKRDIREANEAAAETRRQLEGGDEEADEGQGDEARGDEGQGEEPEAEQTEGDQP